MWPETGESGISGFIHVSKGMFIHSQGPDFHTDTLYASAHC